MAYCCHSKDLRPFNAPQLSSRIMLLATVNGHVKPCKHGKLDDKTIMMMMMIILSWL